MHHTGRHSAARPKLLRGPTQDEIEGVRLPRNQRVRLFGAVAKQVGAGIAPTFCG